MNEAAGADDELAQRGTTSQQPMRGILSILHEWYIYISIMLVATH
jgi:hypothetical protein